MNKNVDFVRKKIWHMKPFCEASNENENTIINFSDDTLKGLTKLGEILKGISLRQKTNGYCIMDGGIYTLNNELIYEKDKHTQLQRN
jgi:hypothetical protein